MGVLRLEVYTHEPPLLRWVSLDAPEPSFCLDFYSAASQMLRHYCDWCYYKVLVKTASEGGYEWKTAVKARQNMIFLFCKPEEWQAHKVAYLQFLLIYLPIKSTVALLKILHLIPSYRKNRKSRKIAPSASPQTLHSMSLHGLGKQLQSSGFWNSADH